MGIEDMEIHKTKWLTAEGVKRVNWYPHTVNYLHYLQMSVRSSKKTLFIECCSVTSINRC